MPEIRQMTYLSDLWNEDHARALGANQLALLRYRSNLLGADLRITNFGGGNTSSKTTLPDPLTGEPARVLAVKGSGGDLRSIGTNGFALLYLDKLERLIARYRGEAHEDEQADCYRASILTIDQMGQFVNEHAGRRDRVAFGGASVKAGAQDDSAIAAVLPYLRGAVSTNRRVIAHVERTDEALEFASSAWAEDLCALGTS